MSKPPKESLPHNNVIVGIRKRKQLIAFFYIHLIIQTINNKKVIVYCFLSSFKISFFYFLELTVLKFLHNLYHQINHQLFLNNSRIYLN